jgi:hypothetical protein
MHHSQASLNNVAYVELYIHSLDASCNGILIKHKDGREEALGQRRVGLSNIQTTTVLTPSRMYHKRFRTSNECWRLKVIFSTLDEPKICMDRDEGWLSNNMVGTITWNFDWKNDELQFFDAEQEPGW